MYPRYSNDDIYFIDSAVSEIPTLLAGLPETAEVHVVESDRDGLDQILSQVNAGVYGAIHILCHGEPGRLSLGAGTIGVRELDERAADFARLGRALDADGDLLLYGCNVARGESGRAFVARIADLTGAGVAASETLTGAAALGGNWRLDVRQGAVRSRPLEIGAYQGVFTAPVVTGPQPVAFTEGAGAQPIQGVALANGFGYAGGSVWIQVSAATVGDQLVLTSDGDANASGAISVDAGVVYLGDGSGRTAIGTVDATENGQNGAALVINFDAIDSGVIANPSFEHGLTGWTVGEERVVLGTTPINGWMTPADTRNPLNNSVGDGGQPSASASYRAEVSAGSAADGANALWLRLESGSSSAPFGVIHGPYAYSDDFSARAGDILNFEWKAQGGTDAFDAFGYLMKADGSAHVEVLNETGTSSNAQTPWTTASVVVPSDGEWFFVFVAGSYDFNGGTAFGGSLYIDNFRVDASPVTDEVIEAIVAKVTYQNTADAAIADERTLTVTVSDGVGGQASAGGELTVANVNDAPTGQVIVSGDLEQDAILTASNDIADPDGDGPVSYQWQRGDGLGGWADIDGAVSPTYALTQADVGKTIRAVAVYTDGGGTSESVFSAGTAVVADAQFAPTGAVTVTGDAEQGAILTAANTLADADGMGTIAYQWQRADGAGGWADIDGGAGATYALAQADVGRAVRVVASYTDGDGTAESVASAATTAVANVNDAPTGGVTIDGAPLLGQTLTASNTLADADGLGTISYQWQVDGVDVVGATGPTFLLTDAHIGGAVSVVASYMDGYGTLESVASPSTAAVVDPPPPPPQPVTEIVDGVPVVTETTINADGTVSQVVVVPVVTEAREEQVGDADLADIPLFAFNGWSVLTAQAPTGLGLQASGLAWPKPAGESFTDLIREIQARTVAGSTAQAEMTGGGSGFLQDLPASTLLSVHTIVPTTAAGAPAPAEPLVIRGAAPGWSGVTNALVIDVRGLAGGAALQLQDVEFAAVVGAAHIAGGDTAQTVFGDGADQHIVLGAGDDVVHGGGGNDVLSGGAGDDLLDGGEGIDTILLEAPLAELQFTHGAAGLRIAGPNGVDVAINVEALRTMDGETITDLVNLVDGTTSVATLTYQFFTGASPTGAGLEYLLNAPDEVNGADLTDAYYQGFNLENRYINFAMNLASEAGEAHAWFEANYGGLDMAAALDKAYVEIFGWAPEAGQAETILQADVGGGTTRQAYFEALGGPQLATAGLIGWLLAEAAKGDKGRYAEANNAFLEDFLDGQAQLNVDLLGAYGQPGDGWAA